MKKTILYMITALLIATFLSACEGSAGQKELIHYINDCLPPIAEIETRVINRYDSVSGENYTDDLTMYTALKDEIVPNSLKLIEAAEAITVENEKIKDLHEIYIDAINKQHSAFTTILSAIESQDYSKVSEANTMLSDARKGVRDYLYALEELKKEYNVVTDE